MSVKNVELEEQLSMFEGEDANEADTNGALETEDKFKEAVYAQMRNIHNEGMIVGFQTACHTALDKIYTFERNAGKKSANDYKRCIKDLKKFFEIGVSRKENDAEATEDVETAQN